MTSEAAEGRKMATAIDAAIPIVNNVIVV